MPLLTRDTCDAFLHRFNGFFDGVIRRVELTYAELQVPGEDRRSCRLWIDCRSVEESRNSGWVRVRLGAEDVREYSFREPQRLSHQVLSDGLRTLWFEESVGLEFAGEKDSLSSLADLQSSSFYLVAGRVRWDVEEA